MVTVGADNVHAFHNAQKKGMFYLSLCGQGIKGA